MATQIPPTTEPASVVAGDTLAWTKTVPLYPATAGFTLTYSLQNIGNVYTFVATPSGADYNIVVSAATTSQWVPGNYVLVGYITDGLGARITVNQSDLEVEADPSQARPSTHATRTLALIEAAIEGRIPNGMENYVIDGQSVYRIQMEKLVTLRSYYRDLVKNEIAQDMIDRGLGNPRNSFARFKRAGAALRPPFSPPYA